MSKRRQDRRRTRRAALVNDAGANSGNGSEPGTGSGSGTGAGTASGAGDTDGIGDGAIGLVVSPAVRSHATALAGTPDPAAVPATAAPDAARGPAEPLITVDAPQPLVIESPLHGDAEAVAATESLLLQPVPLPAAVEGAGDGQVPPSLPVDPTLLPVPRPAGGGSRRAHALDALRGLFLLAMTFGFTIDDGFPPWMYHRQFPPPGDLVNIPGIAWRDLTYVAFLFTMAAALPITNSRRIARGETEIGIVAGAIKRYAMLLLFALLVGHANTYFIGYTQVGRAIALAGFVVMALLFTRPLPSWNPATVRWARRAGWVGAVALLLLSPRLYGSSFSVERIDDVIAGLAFASLAGTITWYFTRDNLVVRLGVLAAAAALYLGAREPGWVQDWWWSSSIPWALAPSRLSLMLVVVPGTIAGDLLLRWMRHEEAPGAHAAHWGGWRVAMLATLSAAAAPLLVVGMYNRASLLTTQLAVAIGVVGLFLTHRPATALERTLRSLFTWGITWLVLGLFCEPFEGGMKKVPETLSYLFAVTGVAALLLVALMALVDGLRKRRVIEPLLDIGQNPLLCYVLYTVLINSALEMVPAFRGVLRNNPGEMLLRSLLEVGLVMLVVRFTARRRVFWRT